MYLYKLLQRQNILGGSLLTLRWWFGDFDVVVWWLWGCGLWTLKWWFVDFEVVVCELWGGGLLTLDWHDFQPFDLPYILKWMWQFLSKQSYTFQHSPQFNIVYIWISKCNAIIAKIYSLLLQYKYSYIRWLSNCSICIRWANKWRSSGETGIFRYADSTSNFAINVPFPYLLTILITSKIINNNKSLPRYIVR